MAGNESSRMASISWGSGARHQGDHKNTGLGRSVAASEHQVDQRCDLGPRKLTQPEALCPGAGRRGELLVPQPGHTEHIPGAAWGRLYVRPDISGAALTSLHLIGPHNSTRSPPYQGWSTSHSRKGLSPASPPIRWTSCAPPAPQLTGFPSLPVHRIIQTSQSRPPTGARATSPFGYYRPASYCPRRFSLLPSAPPL